MCLNIENLNIGYGDNLVLQNVNLQLAQNEICAIIGMSGCGKSSLLKTIANVIKPISGIIKFNEEILNPKTKKIGFVMQDYDLYYWQTVMDNCLLPYKIRNMKISQDVSNQLDYYLGHLNINQFKKNKINELSKGQQQRVSLARIFLLKPDLILLDEAFANLDLITKDDTINLFLDLWSQRTIPTIIVTHSIDEALFMANKIVVIDCMHKMHILENPLFKNKNYRHSSDYSKLYQNVESLIKGNKNV